MPDLPMFVAANISPLGMLRVYFTIVRSAPTGQYMMRDQVTYKKCGHFCGQNATKSGRKCCECRELINPCWVCRGN